LRSRFVANLLLKCSKMGCIKGNIKWENVKKQSTYSHNILKLHKRVHNIYVRHHRCSQLKVESRDIRQNKLIHLLQIDNMYVNIVKHDTI